MEFGFNYYNYYYNVGKDVHAAKQILQEGNWFPDDSIEQKVENARAKRGNKVISEIQGSLNLRKKVVGVLNQTNSLHALSPKALRACKEVNSLLFTILQWKRLAHVLNFNNEVTLPDNTKISLEGFNETFTLPMLASSLFTFASKLNDPQEQEKICRIGETLANALCHDRLNPEKIEKALEELYRGFPIVVISGWDWHTIGVILLKGEDNYYLISCNTGDDSNSGSAKSGCSETMWIQSSSRN